MATLTTELVAVFGTGKSFKNRETTILPAGTEIGSRSDRDGWHFFQAKEYGRWTAYAVEQASRLDLAINPSGERIEVTLARSALNTLTPEERAKLFAEYPTR